MLTLYGINLSTFTRKLRLALAEKGIDYRFEQAPMGSARVRALHPLAKILDPQRGREQCHCLPLPHAPPGLAFAAPVAPAAGPAG